MLILINGLRSVRTDRCGPMERGLGRTHASLKRMREWMHWAKPQRTLPMRRVFIAFVAACSLTSPGAFGQTPATTGRVEGAVFVGVSSGHAFAAGATVMLSGRV